MGITDVRPERSVDAVEVGVVSCLNVVIVGLVALLTSNVDGVVVDSFEKDTDGGVFDVVVDPLVEDGIVSFDVVVDPNVACNVDVVVDSWAGILDVGPVAFDVTVDSFVKRNIDGVVDVVVVDPCSDVGDVELVIFDVVDSCVYVFGVGTVAFDVVVDSLVKGNVGEVVVAVDGDPCLDFGDVIVAIFVVVVNSFAAGNVEVAVVASVGVVDAEIVAFGVVVDSFVKREVFGVVIVVASCMKVGDISLVFDFVVEVECKVDETVGVVVVDSCWEVFFGLVALYVVLDPFVECNVGKVVDIFLLSCVVAGKVTLVVVVVVSAFVDSFL